MSKQDRVSMAALNSSEAESKADDHPPLWIFFDDSNVWIEAKKLASLVSGYKTTEDHRIRINIGRLLEIVARGRKSRVSSILYGSEPPPIDTVWKKAKDYGFVVKSHNRSKDTGKEKKVDSSLSADLTEVAIEHKDEKGVIVLVAGDADFIPPITKALDREWDVEIYMWRHAISQEIKKLSEKDNKLKIFKLDEHLSKITFTEMELRLSEGYNGAAIKASGVVLHLRQHEKDESLERKIENIAQWPFQHFFPVDRHGEKKKDVVVLYFKGEKQRQFDVKEFVEKFNEHFPSYSAQPYLQYVQREDNELRRLISTCTTAETALGEETNQEVVTNEESSAINKDEPFKLVAHNFKRRIQRFSEHCKYKFYCKMGNKCEYFHTKEEKEKFKQREGKNNNRKTILCKYHPNCRRTKERCDFAHGDSDAVCIKCCNQGHLVNNCEN